MSGRYQILLITDDESKADLIQLQLDKIDIPVQLDIISKEHQLIDRLENNPPDLIVSNYDLPTFPGAKALDIVRDIHPHTPFIFVFGPPGEEEAIDAIRRGGSDYITKQNLDRLGPAVLREIATYKQNQKQSTQLKETNNRYKSLIQSVNGIVWEADADTFKFQYISSKIKELLGYTPKEWLSKPNFWQEHIHPADRKEAIEYCHHKSQQGKDHSFEYRILDADDEVVWLRDYVTVVTKNGDPDQLHGLMVDITKEKEAEREKIEILQRIGDAFFAVDEDWTVTYWNKRAEQVLDTSSDDIIGKNLWNVYDDAVELDFYTQYHKAVDKQVTVNFEEFYPGVEKWFEVSAYPSETGLSVYFRDITERKENHEQLKRLNQELEERAKELAATNEELEQFAYVASHDLQEPLRMVSSFLDRLEQKYSNQLDDKAQQYINFAVDGAHRMRRIILDLLNYSRMDQNNFAREQVNVNDLLQEILKLEHTTIKENNANIVFDNLPVIEASKTPMQQVFQNLINNAIKYHKPGTKPIVKIESKEADNYWEFSVTDNGIGIRDEFQDTIFTIFQRLHTQNEYPGTGIGLSVSKKIIEKHGGKIWVKSEIGEGSTFYFTVRKSD
ncbi:hypothetical protein CK503_15390 [Aliifodinibius salipaludis]|uniref:histidine kinase n=1 Tax=Fodinibius salipaludis TaxID=2032627 RepID=A0A2A2G4P3_9BACT|nr:ATP-binding protein [Aliifodinibius salipaludis]PAU92746.1 hypothetical protein CK503_15390 [Aliifodinibius salipaludis]